MRKLITLSVLATLLLSINNTQGQQRMITNSYLVNPYYYNPAYAGKLNGIEGTAGFKRQWMGMANAPISRYVSVNGSVLGNMGLGANISIDQTDIFESFNARVSYSYQVELGEEHDLTFGIEGDIKETRIDAAGLQNGDFNDPVILSNANYKGTGFDVNFGIRYHMKGLEVGVSAFQLIESSTEIAEVNNDVVNYENSRHIFSQLSYDIELVEDVWMLRPLAFVRYSSNAPVSFDGGLTAQWNKLLNLSVLYRKNTGIVGALSVDLKNTVSVGYAYEAVMGNNLSNYTTGSHEVFLGLRFGRDDNEKRVKNLVNEQNIELQNRVEALEQRIAAGKDTSEIAAIRAELDELKAGGAGSYQEAPLSALETGNGTTLQPGHYIVIQSYRDKGEAEDKLKDVKSKGYNPILVYNKIKGYYYVYLERFDNLQTALKELENAEASGFEDAWIYMHK
jgi:type IX secretion system PorP/SprF family membrane protein